jgi:hypothetical protein
MALQFEFRKEKIVLNAKLFMFDEFTAIWKHDKTKGKLKANSLLYFVYLLCDIGENNPLRDVDADKREIEAKFRAFLDKDKVFSDTEFGLLEPAVNLYILLNTTPEERLLVAFDQKAIQLATMLESTTPETVTNSDNGVVTFVSNSGIITGALSKLSIIRKNRASIVASIKNEAMLEKIRGQLTLSPLVRGLITLHR